MQTRNRQGEEQQFLYQGLSEMLNPKHELYQLAHRIPWDELDGEFSKYYVKFGRPAIPTRVMISLLLLKQLYDYGDETAIAEWVQNPYWQYFSGENTFQWKVPCDPSDLSHFRGRIGKQGVEKIFNLSVKLHGDKAQEKEVVIDTTVQDKNITFPTDTKLHRKIAEKCVKIAKEESLNLRRSYKRKIPKLLYAQRGRHHPSGHKKALKAAKQLKTIAGRLVRELERKLQPSVMPKYLEELQLFKRVLAQKRSSSNKVYSLHEPHVYCMSKGKDHKKYEYGSKVSIGMTKSAGIIVSALNFERNVYDGHTLPSVLKDIERVTGNLPKAAIVDQGYRGKKKIGTTEIINADTLRRASTKYQKQQTKKRLRRRAAVEPIIGHLKQDFRLSRNFLKGISGDHINVLLAAAAHNIRKWLRKARFIFVQICQFLQLITFRRSGALCRI